MKSIKIIELIKDHIDQFKGRRRIDIIKDLQYYLAFELRWAELTEEEREDARNIRELNNNTYEALDKMNKEKREKYIEMYARAEYIRQCAWFDYLTGVSNEKPPVLSSEKIS